MAAIRLVKTFFQSGCVSIQKSSLLIASKTMSATSAGSMPRSAISGAANSSKATSSLELLPQRLCQCNHAKLRHVIRINGRSRLKTRGKGCIDNMALTTLFYQWQKSFDAVSHTPKIYAQHLFPVSNTEVSYRTGYHHAGIIVNYVNRAESLHRPGCKRLYRVPL